MPVDVNEYNRILPLKMAVENKIIKMPGVTGVDVGLKEINGEQTTIHAIIVFVEKKGVFAPEHEIPKMISGVPTDVIEAIFSYHSGPDTAFYNPVKGGCSIAPARFSNMAGTLGMLVNDASTGAPLWLSAYHVVCGDPGWNAPGVSTSITQPAIDDGGNSGDSIGNIDRGVHGEVDVSWGYNLYVDCAAVSTTGRATSSIYH